MDVVYMRVKEMYEDIFYNEDMGSIKIDLKKVDDTAFGFDLDSNKQIVGHFYIFLMTIYNLIDVKGDKTPVIDSKGNIQGYVRYSIGF